MQFLVIRICLYRKAVDCAVLWGYQHSGPHLLLFRHRSGYRLRRNTDQTPAHPFPSVCALSEKGIESTCCILPRLYFYSWMATPKLDTSQPNGIFRSPPQVGSFLSGLVILLLNFSCSHFGTWRTHRWVSVSQVSPHLRMNGPRTLPQPASHDALCDCLRDVGGRWVGVSYWYFWVCLKQCAGEWGQSQ